MMFLRWAAFLPLPLKLQENGNDSLKALEKPLGSLIKARGLRLAGILIFSPSFNKGEVMRSDRLCECPLSFFCFLVCLCMCVCKGVILFWGLQQFRTV